MVSMSFAETQHPRTPSGRFATKINGAPSGSLTAPLPDPFAHQMLYPTLEADRALFVECDSFQSVDDAYARAASVPSRTDKMMLRWAAIARNRQLRESGATGVPTALGEDNPFAHTQSDVELYEMYSSITEEPPGDGELNGPQWSAWVLRLTGQYNARRDALRRARAVGAYRM